MLIIGLLNTKVLINWDTFVPSGLRSSPTLCIKTETVLFTTAILQQTLSCNSEDKRFLIFKFFRLFLPGVFGQDFNKSSLPILGHSQFVLKSCLRI